MTDRSPERSPVVDHPARIGTERSGTALSAR
jgi:hypothetical protein